MAHKKAGGSTANGRDSTAKRRGVKRFAGERVNAGEILVRQKGFWYRPGTNTYAAKDWSIHAGITGKVSFHKCKMLKFNSRREMATIVNVVPA